MVAKNAFVFLGQINPIKKIDYDRILKDFDDLLPLYRYVESKGESKPIVDLHSVPFGFRHGCTVKKLKTSVQSRDDSLDVTLRHNSLQLALYKSLVAKYGRNNVGTEIPTGNGARIDVVVKQADAMWFYEIKTFHSPRACIRDALGQLLEYSHWPNGIAADRLIVVGENQIDDDGQQYLKTLKVRYSLPIEYCHIEI